MDEKGGVGEEKGENDMGLRGRDEEGGRKGGGRGVDGIVH